MIWSILSFVFEFLFIVTVCHFFFELKRSRPIKWKVSLDRAEAKMPAFAKPGDAGADLCSAFDYVVPPGEVVAVDTGLRWEVPFGYEVQVRPRSGLALKNKVSVLNTPGTVDAAYRGPVKVLLYNHGNVPFKVDAGAKIAQAVVSKLTDVEIVKESTLSSTVRGSGGFGSTGA
jgi:dUTP pyrophosphatase